MASTIGGYDINTESNQEKLRRVTVTASSDKTFLDVAKINTSTGALATIDYEHNEIHDGDHFFIYKYKDMSGSATYTFLIVTPNTTKWAHILFIFITEGETNIKLTEGVSVAANGTAVPSFNSNRNVAGTATVLVYDTPTSPTGGTVLAQNQIGSGRSISGSTRNTDEIILKQNTKYLLTIQNISSTDNLINWSIVWYEHTDRT